MEHGLFPEIPNMENCGISITEMEDCGDGNYVTIFEGTTKETYDRYLLSLKKAGFKKIVDNVEGLAGAVFSVTYVKDKWTVTVIYIVKMQRTYISVCLDKPLSSRLFYQEEYVAGKWKNAKTKLYMRELWWFGNSFVLQLKNGHFLISDGGQASDAAYLVDDLERVTPKGEKPVVEGWFISHGHMDHCGVFREFLDRPELRDRIYVEGIYFSIVGESFYAKDAVTRIDSAYVKLAASQLKRKDGGRPEIYRPHTGQRYYFCDITVDVVHTQEQRLREIYTSDVNGATTLLMVNIEGQKCFFTGDADWGCMKTLMATYDKEYLNVDVMTLMHHGFNTDDRFTDYCKVKTLLLTSRDISPVSKANENDYLKANVEEYFPWGDGAKVLTFPYTVGSYECMPKTKWIYHNESERKQPLNVHRYWKRQCEKEIRTLRIMDHGLSKHAETLINKIRQRVPMQFTEDGMMIELEIDSAINSDKKYSICMVDPTGWKLSAVNEEMLYIAIDIFLDTAEWSERGFIARELESTENNS